MHTKTCLYFKTAFCLFSRERSLCSQKLTGFHRTNGWTFRGRNSQYRRQVACLVCVFIVVLMQCQLQVGHFVSQYLLFVVQQRHFVVLCIGLPRANVLRLYRIPISFQQHIQESGGQEGAEKSDPGVKNPHPKPS